MMMLKFIVVTRQDYFLKCYLTELKFKRENCSGGKISKKRLTVIVYADMTTGTSKNKFFVIGKSKTPRCFKNFKSFPVIYEYEANKRAWMKSELWDRFLQKWDTELKRKREKMFLLLDNCLSHLS
jgi:hypothetical protein